MQQLSKLASQALMLELETYPKPGLVSFLDNGSHNDMDANTFIASINSLSSYWQDIAEAGLKAAPFSQLKSLGVNAEEKMLQSTNGVNTHRGAIFILGLLLASCAYTCGNNLPFANVSSNLVKLWGDALAKHQPNNLSNGARVRAKYGVSSIVNEASGGFLLIFNTYLPLLEKLKYEKNAYIQLFFEILVTANDTNLLHRGNLDGLNYARQVAREFLSNGGIKNPNYYVHAINIHQNFVERNLSPGGVADLFTATIFLDLVRDKLWA